MTASAAATNSSQILFQLYLPCAGCGDTVTYPGYLGGPTGISYPQATGLLPPSSQPFIGSAVIDVFDKLPLINQETVDIDNLTLNNFSFIQTGENLFVADQQVVRINGQKYLTIALGQNKVPPVLKTIGVTIFDSVGSNQAFSFILRPDVNNNYSAVIAPLRRAGLYPINVHIIDFRNQRIKKLSGILQVSSISLIPAGRLSSVFENLISPVVITSGVLAGASQILAFSSVASIYDVYLLILRGFGALGSVLGIRRKRKPWGTVYDAVTKRPIDPAYVTIYKNGQKVASAITDIEGRYGFFVPPGTYQLMAEKTHYRFPSKILAGKLSDELYDKLYFGEAITITEGQAITSNIPLDPVDFDWNEFSKGGDESFKRSYDKKIAQGRFYRFLSLAGLFLTVGLVLFTPSILNVIVLLVYIGLDSVTRRRANRYQLVTIKKQLTGEPIPFAIIRVFLAGLDKEVKTIVADRYGRFYLLVRPGTYYLTIDQKLPDGSYFTFYKTETRDLPNGVWASDIVISRFRGSSI